MSRVDIFFTVSQQILSQDSDNPTLHAGDRNHFYAVFDLEEVFLKLSPKAVFKKQCRAVLMDLTLNDDGKFECLIPWEVMTEPGFFTVGIFGGDMMLTNDLSIRVAKGCAPEGSEPLEPTKGWFRLIEGQIEALEENKVDKVDGKQLSTNDYTDKDKKKLDGIAEGAEANVRTDWNEEDESKPNFLLNKVPLKNGNFKNAFMLLTAKNVFSANAIALGPGSVAGGMGFKITAFSDVLENNTGYYTLRTTEGLEVGMEYFVKLHSQKTSIGTIIDIVGNDVYVDSYEKIEFDIAEDDPENFRVENYLIVPGRPDLGDMEVGFNSVSFGENCIAQEYDTFAGGRNTNIVARFGFGWGRDLKAGYAAAVFGRNNQALAMGSLAQGYGAIVLPGAAYSDAIGSEVVAGSPNQIIRGKWNIVDRGREYILILGNGTGPNSKSNAHTVDWKGNGWYQGDVFVGSDRKKLATEKFVEDRSEEFIEQGGELVKNTYAELTIEPVMEGLTERLIFNSKIPDIKYQVFAGETPFTENPILMSEATVTAFRGFEGSNVTIKFFVEDKVLSTMQIVVMNTIGATKLCRLCEV